MLWKPTAKKAHATVPASSKKRQQAAAKIQLIYRRYQQRLLKVGVVISLTGVGSKKCIVRAKAKEKQPSVSAVLLSPSTSPATPSSTPSSNKSIIPSPVESRQLETDLWTIREEKPTLIPTTAKIRFETLRPTAMISSIEEVAAAEKEQHMSEYHNLLDFEPALSTVRESKEARNHPWLLKSILGADIYYFLVGQEFYTTVSYNYQDIVPTSKLRDHVIEPSDSNLDHELQIKAFDTMRSEMKSPAMRVFGYVLMKFFRHVLHTLQVDQASIQVLRHQLVAQRHRPIALVYTPTHRSHLDYLIITFVCFMHSLPVPRIAAGCNLNIAGGIGSWLRWNGSFFIKRSFRGNGRYKHLLVSYIGALLKFGRTPLEIFVEGTRSRHGRIAHPKLGFLSMLSSILSRGTTNNENTDEKNNTLEDIQLVPIAIDYERVFLEDMEYARQLRGRKKDPESLWGLLTSCWHTVCGRASAGHVYVRFGPTISLAQFSSNTSGLPEIGQTLVEAMQHQVTITSTAIVSALILLHSNTNDVSNSTSSSVEIYTREDLCRDAQDIQREITRRKNVHVAPFESIESLVDRGLNAISNLDAENPESILQLVYYRSALLFPFYVDALRWYCTRTLPTSIMSIESWMEKATVLHQYLKKYCAQSNTIDEVVDVALRAQYAQSSSSDTGSTTIRFLFYSLIAPYVESMWIFQLYLVQTLRKPTTVTWTKKQWTQHVQAFAMTECRASRQYYESISVDHFQQCFDFSLEVGLFEAATEDHQSSCSASSHAHAHPVQSYQITSNRTIVQSMQLTFSQFQHHYVVSLRCSLVK